MRAWHILTAAAVLALLASSANAGGGIWTPLDVPGAHSTIICGIDGNNIVGFYFYSDEAWNHGFLYDGTDWFAIDVPGAYYTLVCGIEGGSIVGSYGDALGNHGFLYDGTILTTLDLPQATFPNAEIRQVEGISGSTLVGGYQDGHAAHRGFIYDGGSWTALDVPEARDHTYANSIDGRNVVGAFRSWYGDLDGFVHNLTSGEWTILRMPGAAGTSVHDSDGGNLVGYYYLPNGGRHGFLYNGTTWTTLDMPGAVNTCITGISGRTLVGWYQLTSSSPQHGFVYTISAPAIDVSVTLNWD